MIVRTVPFSISYSKFTHVSTSVYKNTYTKTHLSTIISNKQRGNRKGKRYNNKTKESTASPFGMLMLQCSNYFITSIPVPRPPWEKNRKYIIFFYSVMIPKSMKIKCHGTPKNRFPLINEPAADLHEITIVNHHYVSSLARHVGLGSSAVTANLIQFSNFDDKQHTTPHVISTRGCCFYLIINCASSIMNFL